MFLLGRSCPRHTQHPCWKSADIDGFSGIFAPGLTLQFEHWGFGNADRMLHALCSLSH